MRARLMGRPRPHACAEAQPPTESALTWSRSTFEIGHRLARVRREPGRVAPREGRRRDTVQEHREGDGEEDGGEQDRLVREVGVCDENDREDDRRQSARAEPAEEGDRGRPRTRPSIARTTGTMRTTVRLRSAYRTMEAERSSSTGTSMTAPKRTNVTAPSKPPASSRKSVTSPPTSRRRPPKTAPPTKAAMNPLPPIHTASPYASPAPATGTNCSQIGSTRRRRTPSLTTAAAASPAATPARPP